MPGLDIVFCVPTADSRGMKVRGQPRLSQKSFAELCGWDYVCITRKETRERHAAILLFQLSRTLAITARGIPFTA
jgi:hypothetical protein